MEKQTDGIASLRSSGLAYHQHCIDLYSLNNFHIDVESRTGMTILLYLCSSGCTSKTNILPDFTVDAKINTLESEGIVRQSFRMQTKRASQFDHSTDKVRIVLLRSKGIGQ